MNLFLMKRQAEKAEMMPWQNLPQPTAGRMQKYW
jgi:hypothetical protein